MLQTQKPPFFGAEPYRALYFIIARTDLTVMARPVLAPKDTPWYAVLRWRLIRTGVRHDGGIGGREMGAASNNRPYPRSLWLARRLDALSADRHRRKLVRGIRCGEFGNLIARLHQRGNFTRGRGLRPKVELLSRRWV